MVGLSDVTEKQFLGFCFCFCFFFAFEKLGKPRRDGPFTMERFSKSRYVGVCATGSYAEGALIVLSRLMTSKGKWSDCVFEKKFFANDFTSST